MSTRKLSGKLQGLEAVGLVEHAGPFGHPTEARYSLTHKGVVITRLGEPVLLYLRLAEGWTAPIRREIRTNATVLPEAKAPRDPPERRRESDGSPRASGPRAVGRTLR